MFSLAGENCLTEAEVWFSFGFLSAFLGFPWFSFSCCLFCWSCLCFSLYCMYIIFDVLFYSFLSHGFATASHCAPFVFFEFPLVFTWSSCDCHLVLPVVLFCVVLVFLVFCIVFFCFPMVSLEVSCGFPFLFAFLLFSLVIAWFSLLYMWFPLFLSVLLFSYCGLMALCSYGFPWFPYGFTWLCYLVSCGFPGAPLRKTKSKPGNIGNKRKSMGKQGFPRSSNHQNPPSPPN